MYDWRAAPVHSDQSDTGQWDSSRKNISVDGPAYVNYVLICPDVAE